MTIQDNEAQMNDSIDHLLRQRERIQEFILDLALDTKKSKVENLLWQVSAEFKRCVDRRITGDQGSEKEFERLEVFNLIAMMLMSRMVDEHSLKREKGKRWTRKERRTARFLVDAMTEFNVAQADFLTRFPEPDLKPLPAKIQMTVYDVTVADAEEYAVEIRERLNAIKAMRTKERNEETERP